MKMILFSALVACFCAALLPSCASKDPLTWVSVEAQGTNSSKTMEDDSDGIRVVPIVSPSNQMQADTSLLADEDASDSDESTEVIPENEKDLHERDLDEERKAFQNVLDEYEKDAAELKKQMADFIAFEEQLKLVMQDYEVEKKDRLERLKSETDTLEKKLKDLETKEGKLLKKRGELDAEEKTLADENGVLEKGEAELEDRNRRLDQSKADLEAEKKRLKDIGQRLEDTNELISHEEKLQKEYAECIDFPPNMQKEFEENSGMKLEVAKICYKKQGAKGN